jgi:uncharacterized membrane protein YheB (UPF0754 family)
LSVLAVNTVSEAWHVFTDHPVVLLMMPVVGGFIGWITKVMAIWMVFNPIEFKGIGPIGWQGQLPKRAAKFGSHASELILENLIDPRALVDKLDPQRITAELDDVMVEIIDDIARDILGDRWDGLPAAAKAPIYARARARAPQTVASLLDYAKRNIDELFDLSYITTSNLIRDKELLNELVRDTIVPEMKFMKRFGTIFGAAVGGAQMVVFSFTESHLLIPLAGLSVGLVSDWIALQMVFQPRKPKTYLGVFKWHGLFFKRREEFAEDYARIGAEKVLTPGVILESLLNGPLADRLFGMVKNEVESAIDEELDVVGPLVPATIGSDRYSRLRNTVVAKAQARLPEAAVRLEGYTAEAIDIENTAKESLAALSDEEYEGMLRPVFKDDEWLVVAVGGALGFFVGEFQVFLLEKLGGL